MAIFDVLKTTAFVLKEANKIEEYQKSLMYWNSFGNAKADF